MARNRKGKLFTLFEDTFRISFFYKPSLTNDDQFYYIILDDKVRLCIKVYNNSIIVIREIIPMNDGYMPKFYEKLVDFFVNQTMFTVLISKLGATLPIKNACEIKGVPVVEDDRFITIPMKVYERMVAMYNNDIDKYGFWLLAVNHEEEDIQPEKPMVEDLVVTNKPEKIDKPVKKDISEPKPERVDVKNTPIGNVPIYKLLEEFIKAKYPDSQLIEEPVPNNVYLKQIFHFNINKLNLSIQFTLDKNTLCISSIDVIGNNVQYVSNLTYLELMETLEDFTDTADIHLENVNKGPIYEICKLRSYERLDIRFTDLNNFGCYKIIKYNRGA